MSDFCEKLQSSLLISYHRRWWIFGWYLICRNMSNDFVCFWKSIHAFKKHTSFVWICSLRESNPRFPYKSVGLTLTHIRWEYLQPAADPYNVVCIPPHPTSSPSGVSKSCWSSFASPSPFTAMYIIVSSAKRRVVDVKFSAMSLM